MLQYMLRCWDYPVYLRHLVLADWTSLYTCYFGKVKHIVGLGKTFYGVVDAEGRQFGNTGYTRCTVDWISNANVYVVLVRQHPYDLRILCPGDCCCGVCFA